MEEKKTIRVHNFSTTAPLRDKPRMIEVPDPRKLGVPAMMTGLREQLDIVVNLSSGKIIPVTWS